MHPFRVFAAVLFVLSAVPVRAQELAQTCRASSSYDVTLEAQALVFDRAAPAPFRVEIHQGTLSTDGAPVRLSAEEQDRMTLFERELRALVPRVRAVATQGVDMAVRAMRAEVGDAGMSEATRAEFERRLDEHASDLKQRIAASKSTHDWQGDAADRYASQIATDLMPLLAADIGQQAIDAALRGDMQAAADLRDRAAGLASQLEPHLRQRMQALRPQIQALCPSIQRLAELQQGVRDGHGHPLDLLQVAP
jgi:hypothetical protein